MLHFQGRLYSGQSYDPVLFHTTSYRPHLLLISYILAYFEEALHAETPLMLFQLRNDIFQCLSLEDSIYACERESYTMIRDTILIDR